MSSSESSDTELLTEWVERKSERAFQELVVRYAGLVHATAKRICGDESMAAEVSQLVFILLARKGASLISRSSLAGWLHTAAMMQTKNLLRGNRREQAKRQRLHAAMNETPPNGNGESWKQMKPVIDQALAALPEKDREALLMYFYRSLNAREIAEALGIATAAAKKRIERATEKLRLKLMSRGVDADGSLSSVMFAGLAADAELAGLPVKLIAAKAMATGTGSGMGAGAVTTFMKATPFVPPVLALVAACIWILPKRTALAAVDREYRTLEAAEAGRDLLRVDRSRDKGGRVTAEKNGNGTRGIDWEKIAMREMDERGSRQVRSFRGLDQMMLDQRLEEMSGEELMAELERIEEADLSEDAKEMVRNRLYHIIARKDPEFALNHLEKWLGTETTVGFALTGALKAYAKKNPAEAMAWLDRQIAEGRLEVKRLDGRNWDRDRLEGALMQAGMTAFPDLVAERLREMEPKDRLFSLGALPPRVPKEEQLAYATLVREVVEGADQVKMVARLGLVLNSDFKWVDNYLETIHATDAEKKATYERAVTYSIMNQSLNRKLTPAEVVKAWSWMGEKDPENRDRLVGDALGNAWSDDRPTGFEDVAKLVTELSRVAKNEGVLVAFLESRGAAMKKERSREIARMITDDGLRERVLEKLK